MALTSSDINIYLTGGSSNTDPNASLGGVRSSTKVVLGTMHNLFRRVTDQEASNGVTLYRCVAIRNDDAVDIMRSVVLYMVFDTKSADSLLTYSRSQVGKNTSETPIADEFTAPTGSNIDFVASLKRSGGVKLGDLSPTNYQMVWLAYTVNPGADQFPDDNFKMRVEVNPPTTSETPVPPPSGGGSEPTTTNFTMATLADCACGSNFTDNWSKIKARNTGFTVFDGDLAYKSGSGCWLEITSGWRSKSGITFGNHDVDEDESQPSTKNALLNAYGYGKTYNKKIFKNVGMIFMESGENQSVSDSVGSSQYNFIKDSLKSFSEDPAIEWIFVFNHYPFYGPDSDHSNESGGRGRYDPLFDTYGVDAVFTGHNHNIWHTKLLKYNSGSPSNPTTAGTDPNYSYSKSADNHGKLYFGVGAGGRSHYDIDSTPSYVVYDNDVDYGYLFMDFTNNGKKITFKFYTKGNTLKNTCTLTHTS